MGCPPKINNFLCCLSLEAGAYIFATISFLVSVLYIGWFSFLIAFFIRVDGTVVNGSMVRVGVGIWIVLSIVLTYYVIYLCATILLIFAVKNKNPRQMEYYMIFMIISVVAAFLNIFLNTTATAIILAILWACFILYCLFCLANLKQKFLNGGTMTA